MTVAAAARGAGAARGCALPWAEAAVTSRMMPAINFLVGDLLVVLFMDAPSITAPYCLFSGGLATRSAARSSLRKPVALVALIADV
jgi:hypothetical protein